MSTDGANRPGREVAYRLFAAEFDDATLSYAESDEERAPNYVIAPTGARLNRVFVVGTLTEVTDVNEEMVRARIVDPTGAFVVYAGQYQPEALAFLERAEPPAFVAVTGKARTFEPDDGDRVYSSIRPESLATVDAATRDRWIVGTAERTRDRIATYAAAAELDVHGDELTEALLANDVPRSLAMGVPLAQGHYGTTPGYLDALDELALDAVRVVAGERSQVDPFEYTPSDAARDGVSFATIAAEADRSYSVPADATAAVENESDEERTTNDVSAGAAIGTAQAGTATAEPEEPSVETVPSEPSAGESTDASSTVDEPDVEGVDGDESTEDASTGGTPPDEASAEGQTEPADGAEEEAAEESTTEVAGEESVETEVTGEQSAEGSTDAPSEPDSGDELGDFDSSGLDEGLYDMDDEEREAVEAEYGTEFTTGTEVDEPGEADIEVPEPEDATGDATDSAFDDDLDEAIDDESDTATDPGTGVTDEHEESGERIAQDGDDSTTDEQQTVDDGEDATEASDQEVDLQTAVVETMSALDDGDGADRSAVVDSVVEETGAASDDVESAIQDALMGGECYEPDDETLKAI